LVKNGRQGTGRNKSRVRHNEIVGKGEKGSRRARKNGRGELSGSRRENERAGCPTLDRRWGMEPSLQFGEGGWRLWSVKGSPVCQRYGGGRPPSVRRRKRDFRDPLSQVILPLHIVRVVLQLNHLPD
jgi:hypothetical protein